MIIHVVGTHRVLEKALYRFPKHKPFDLVDGSVHSRNYLRGHYEGKLEPVEIGHLSTQLIAIEESMRDLVGGSGW